MIGLMAISLFLLGLSGSLLIVAIVEWWSGRHK